MNLQLQAQILLLSGRSFAPFPVSYEINPIRISLLLKLLFCLHQRSLLYCFILIKCYQTSQTSIISMLLPEQNLFHYNNSTATKSSFYLKVQALKKEGQITTASSYKRDITRIVWLWLRKGGHRLLMPQARSSKCHSYIRFRQVFQYFPQIALKVGKWVEYFHSDLVQAT